MSLLCIYLVIFGAKINAEWSLIVAKVHKKWGIIEQKFDFECNFINESKMKPSLLSSATLSAFLPTMPPKTKTRSRLRNRIKPARGQAQKEVAVGQDSLRGKITKETRKLQKKTFCQSTVSLVDFYLASMIVKLDSTFWTYSIFIYLMSIFC